MATTEGHGLAGTSASPPLSPASSSSTLSIPPDNLPETWEGQAKMEQRTPRRSVRGVGRTDESAAATLSDPSNTDNAVTQLRIKQLAISEWHPESESDPWALRTGTKEHPTEKSKSAVILYDKVESGGPSDDVFNDPASVASLKSSFKGILYDNKGKAIKPELPPHLRQFNKKGYTMPEPIPTTRPVNEADTRNDDVDEGWKGYVNSDGTEMDVLSVIGNFSMAARKARGDASPTVPAQGQPSRQNNRQASKSASVNHTGTRQKGSAKQKGKPAHAVPQLVTRTDPQPVLRPVPQSIAQIQPVAVAPSMIPIQASQRPRQRHQVPVITVTAPSFHVQGPDDSVSTAQTGMAHQRAASSNASAAQKAIVRPQAATPEAAVIAPRMTARQVASLPRRMTARQAAIASQRAMEQESTASQASANQQSQQSVKNRLAAANRHIIRGKRPVGRPRKPSTQRPIVDGPSGTSLTEEAFPNLQSLAIQQAVVDPATPFNPPAGISQSAYRNIAPRPGPAPSMIVWPVDTRHTIAQKHAMIVAPNPDVYQSPYALMPIIQESNVRGTGAPAQETNVGESSLRSTSRPHRKRTSVDPDETEDDMDMVERTIGFTRSF
ncbi:hypothetical protein HYFRA_00012544 [Hymenoscyphus fraxineus]|uniref:Uncharacterized protein n=1 Tax=Hymenoscyphus fraxineus TaxID=746836 RepID=A0A9N9L926_9HELO|nr:hypothetical protein HYFRA_00012544 [Hymenoscyphus fraxineus]